MIRFPLLHNLAYVPCLFEFQFTLESPKWPNSKYTKIPNFCEMGFRIGIYGQFKFPKGYPQCAMPTYKDINQNYLGDSGQLLLPNHVW